MTEPTQAEIEAAHREGIRAYHCAVGLTRHVDCMKVAIDAALLAAARVRETEIPSRRDMTDAFTVLLNEAEAELATLRAQAEVLVAALQDCRRYADNHDDEWVPARVDEALSAYEQSKGGAAPATVSGGEKPCAVHEPHGDGACDLPRGHTGLHRSIARWGELVEPKGKDAVR